MPVDYRYVTPGERIRREMFSFQKLAREIGELEERKRTFRQPTPPTGIFSDRLRQGPGFAQPQAPRPPLDPLAVSEAMQRREGPRGLERLAPIPEALERYQTRFADPIAGLAEQGLRFRQIGQVEPTGLGQAQITQPTKEATGERGFVNVPAAWLGSEEEQQKAQEVLEEAGLPRAMALRVLTAPENVLPIVGFTRVDDFARLLKAVKPGTVRQSPKLAKLADEFRLPSAETAVTQVDRQALMQENRALKTLVQEGRATPEQEARLIEVRNQLQQPRLPGEEVGDVSQVPGEINTRALEEEVRLARKAVERLQGSTAKKRDALVPPPIKASAAQGRNAQLAKAEARLEAATKRLNDAYAHNAAIDAVPPPAPEPPVSQAGKLPEDVTPDVERVIQGGEPPRGAAGTIPPEDDWEGAIREGIEQMRANRAGVQPAVKAETARRIVSSEEVYQKALREGKTREEALKLKRGAQAGKKPAPKGVLVELSPEHQEALNRRVDDFDFGRGAGAPDYERDRVRSTLIAMSVGEPVPENQLISLEKVLGPEFVEEFRKSANRVGDLWKSPYEWALLPKAVLSSLDQSAVLRQNIMAVTAHPIEASQSITPAMKALLREDWAQAANRAIIDNPELIQLADGSSISYSELYERFSTMRELGGGLAESEERWRGSLAEHIPLIGRIVRRSNAGFATMGNQMRDRIMKTTIRNWTEGGVIQRNLGFRKGTARPPTLQELEALSDSLNRFTGRGTFKAAGGMAKAVTDTLQAFQWAPQSRVAPLEAAAQMFNWRNPRVAKQATRDVMAFVGTGLTILGLAKLAGADVTLNPNSTDFGKIKAGKLHINLWGVSQPLARTISRVITGTKVDDVLGPVPTDRFNEVKRYFESGLAPEWSAIWDIIRGEEFPGKPLWRGTTSENIKRHALNRFAPLVIQDILEVAEEEGMLIGTMMAPLSFFGGSISAYEPSAVQRLKAIPEHEGVEPKLLKDVKEFRSAVKRFRNKVEEEEGRIVPIAAATRALGEAEGRSDTFIELAARLPSSPTNVEYLRFILENYKEIQEDRPSLITQDIRLAHHEMEEANAAR
jgi:hypothetical protein